MRRHWPATFASNSQFWLGEAITLFLCETNSHAILKRLAPLLASHSD
jgi:hypothetical protein